VGNGKIGGEERLIPASSAGDGISNDRRDHDRGGDVRGRHLGNFKSPTILQVDNARESPGKGVFRNKGKSECGKVGTLNARQVNVVNLLDRREGAKGRKRKKSEGSPEQLLKSNGNK